MDVTAKNKEKMEAINKNGAIDRENPVKWVEVAKIRTADIEDIFEPSFYLKLVNESYKHELPVTLTMRAITDSDPRIANRIQAYFKAENISNGQFETYKPAAYLLQKHALLRDDIDEETVEKAASMFERINALLPSDNFAIEGVNGRAVHTTP